VKFPTGRVKARAMAKLDAGEQNVVDTVSRVGWMVLKVGPTAEDSDPRWFAYTIGLPVTFGWPEFICFGLAPNVVAEVLNNAVAELKARATSPVAGLQLSEVLERSPVRLEAFAPTLYREHLGWAMWFAAHSGLSPHQFGCLQLVWPDKRGRFPAESDCDDAVRQLQKPIIAVN